ncbi:MAG TPA: NAD-dependent epimerase/dehydratase family protein [Bryobacteraceae bacterium]|nr:NAD-dependent epimerase/dehydratase family protein [Bryobacteraceae bacterium]
MSRTCLIGHTGFVGTNLKQQRPFDDLYRSTDIEEIRGKHYDLMVCSGVSAAKWRANQAPEEDRAAIDRLLHNLSAVHADRVILISTVDVYPVARKVDESFDCASLPNHAYGANRLYVENALREKFPNLTIVRLPALFGPGLKKNVIYDLLHNNCLNVINPDSLFQYYDMTSISRDLDTILERQLPVVNLATEPVATKLIHHRFFPDTSIGSDPAPAAAYDIRSRHAGIFGQSNGYRFSADEVLSRLGAYIDSERRNTA